jgi:hypothetical protein
MLASGRPAPSTRLDVAPAPRARFASHVLCLVPRQCQILEPRPTPIRRLVRQNCTPLPSRVHTAEPRPAPTYPACGCTLWRCLQASGVGTWTATVHHHQQADSGLQHKMYFWNIQIKHLQHTPKKDETLKTCEYSQYNMCNTRLTFKHLDETFETNVWNT